MSKLLAGVAALLLLPLMLPATGAERTGQGLRADAGQYEFSAHRRAYQHRHRTVRRSYAPRRYYTGPYWEPAAAYAPMRDPLGLNPAVEYYRRQGRCVTDEGYGRYTFCDD